MKTSDITALAFISAVVETCIRREATFAGRWDVASVLAGHAERVGTDEACEDYPSMPAKLVLSKAKNLIRKQLLAGCACGCRGDFTVPGTYRSCPACGRRNVHYFRQLEPANGDLFAYRECWHCHHAWKHVLEIA